jgi:iron complex outermembrane recepter protein
MRLPKKSAVFRPWPFVVAFALSPSSSLALDEFEPELPLVLSPVRLQQPLSEVPASVTVIDAQQIRAWGIQRVVDVFQYVPGMFVGDELDSRSTSVVYHSGDMSLARRLEVLVDGRSVYESTFARVDWDRLGIAVEDIERVEVTRGPSASSYGLNAFQGVVNIITRHPGDSASGDVAVSYASDQSRHGYASLGFSDMAVQHRVSFFADRVGEYGGLHADADSLPDLRASKGISWSAATHFDDGYDLEWQLSRQDMRRDNFADTNFLTDSPLQDTTSDVAWSRLTHYDSGEHQWQLKAYWTASNMETDYSACTASMGFSSELAALYRQNPEFAEALGYGLLGFQGASAEQSASLTALYSAIAAGAVDAATLESILAGQGSAVSLSDADLQLARQVVAPAVAAGALDEIVCGNGNVDIYEQRADIEFQDTRTWSSQLRSVQGLSWRRDRVSSKTYFDGDVGQDTWSGFFNIEYKPLPEWLLFAGLMAEFESGVGVHYSPRLATTWRLDNFQSVRLQFSRSHRSPDLAERYLNAQASLYNMTPNYLGVDSADLFLQASSDSWEAKLKDEEIRALELGYFATLMNSRVNLDVKLFNENLSRLIGGTVSLLDSQLDNGGNLTLKGIEGQASINLGLRQRLWVVGMLQSRHANDNASGDLVLGAERSLRMAWTRQAGDWEQMAGIMLDQADSGRQPLYRGSDAYRQRVVQWRLARHLSWGVLALHSRYDADAGQVNYERNPRWLTTASYRYNW